MTANSLRACCTFVHLLPSDSTYRIVDEDIELSKCTTNSKFWNLLSSPHPTKNGVCTSIRRQAISIFIFFFVTDIVHSTVHLAFNKVVWHFVTLFQKMWFTSRNNYTLILVCWFSFSMSLIIILLNYVRTILADIHMFDYRFRWIVHDDVLNLLMRQ